VNGNGLEDRIGVRGLGLGELFSEKDQDTSCDETMLCRSKRRGVYPENASTNEAVPVLV